MNRFSLTLAAFVLLAHALSFAAPDEPSEDPINFEVPGAAAHESISPFGVDDANTSLNPFKKLSSIWPEDLVLAPIPAYSDQLGWSLTLAGAYFLSIGEKNADVLPSAIGGFVAGAENGSDAYGAGTHLRLRGDKLRIKAIAARADIRYRFYGIGNSNSDLDIDILQKGPLYRLSASWNVWKKLYVGLGYRYGSVDTRIQIREDPPPDLGPVYDVNLGAIAIPIQIDSRDHDNFPRSGWLISADTLLYRESVGSDFEGEVYRLSANHYHPMRDEDVLASRVVLRSAGEDVPFFLLSTFGGGTDLRGYPSGRYRDHRMYAVQTEYRWKFNNRWIFTGFVGVGEVAEQFTEFGRNFLPAGGVGARFVLSEKHKVGLSVDVATGKDGTEFYFGVGEAF